jgi:hypothetical protein
MPRKTAYLACALLTLAAVATAAWAAAPGPIAKGYYASTHPRLSVYVGKPATKVELYIGCLTSNTNTEYWDSSFLPLRKNSFRFDGKTTINTSTNGTFGHMPGTVLFTGKFASGKFTGTAQIVGSSCPKSNYTAKYNKNGGGSGGGG